MTILRCIWFSTLKKKTLHSSWNPRLAPSPTFTQTASTSSQKLPTQINSKHSGYPQTTLNADCIVDETREASVCVAKSWSCFFASTSTNIEITKPISSCPLKRIVCQCGPKELPHNHTIEFLDVKRYKLYIYLVDWFIIILSIKRLSIFSRYKC